MQLELVPAADGSMFHLRGELDLATGVELLEGLRPALRPGRTICLELSGLGFIDSSGLRALVSAAEALRPEGGLVLEAPTQPVAKLFRLVRADRIPGFQIVDGTDAGLAPASLDGAAEPA
jgi:anti-sigma B factor antagonist